MRRFLRRPRPANTLPIFAGTSGNPFTRSLSRVLLVPVIGFTALFLIGSPAMLISYSYDRGSPKTRYDCVYFSALHGWRQANNRNGFGRRCPVFTTHPITLSDFINP